MKTYLIIGALLFAFSSIALFALLYCTACICRRQKRKVYANRLSMCTQTIGGMLAFAGWGFSIAFAIILQRLGCIPANTSYLFLFVVIVPWFAVCMGMGALSGGILAYYVFRQWFQEIWAD